MKHYNQLTREQRYQIAALLSIGEKKKRIAEVIGVHRSTLYRELERNSVAQAEGRVVYSAWAAQKRATQRRIDKGVCSRKIRGELRALVEKKIRLGWSPEQICGRLLVEQGICLSHETVYQHLLRDSKQGGKLRYSLRHRGYGYRRFRKSRHQRQPKPTIRNVAERPSAADDRTELGHWERDLVHSRQNGPALLACVDRKSRYTLIRWIPQATASIVTEQTIQALGPFSAINRSLTNDNGSEFKSTERVERALELPIYFTDPGAPWQRGTVENTAGLTRQYFPKRAGGRFIRDGHDWLAPAIQQTLNSRPRRALGYRTPQEVFFDTEQTLLSGPESHFGLETNWSS